MIDTAFILKRNQLAHDSSQPHLTNKPSICIQPSSSDAIHQKLWIFLLVLTTVLVLTLLWEGEEKRSTKYWGSLHQAALWEPNQVHISEMAWSCIDESIDFANRYLEWHDTCSTVKTTFGLDEWVILEQENRMLGQTKHACFPVRLYANLNETL